MSHSLTLGDLLLTGSLPNDDGSTFSVLADGASFGVAAGVQEVVRSLLADGDLTRITRYGNREVTFAVEISGSDLAAIARGEAALRRELGRGNLLTWQAPDYFAAPTVFEVITSEMAQVFDDLDELRRRRTFRLTLTCAPRARSLELTMVEALSVTGGSVTTTVVDTGASTTGWSGSRSGAGSPALGIWTGGVGVVDLDNSVTSPETWTLTRTGSVSFSVTNYLVIEARTVSPVNNDITAYASASASGTPLELISSRLVSPDGWYEVTYRASGTAPALTFVHTSAPAEAWQGLIVRKISRTNALPGQTARQPSRIIEVGGTERTPGSLRVSAPDGTSPLNLTLVATWPENGSGFSPPLRRWRTSGNTETTQAGSFSGKREPIGPNFVGHDVPIESLPDGTYQLGALMRATTVGSYLIESVIQSRYNGVTLGETTWSEDVSFPLANDWKFVPMGVYGIPIAAAKAGEFRIAFRTPSTTVVQYDEAWLFPVGDDCGLSIVLILEPNLWLDSPDVNTPTHKVWEGALADKTNAHFPTSGVYTMGEHIFTPPQTATFIATHNVDNPKADLSYYKGWHSNAADD